MNILSRPFFLFCLAGALALAACGAALPAQAPGPAAATTTAQAPTVFPTQGAAGESLVASSQAAAATPTEMFPAEAPTTTPPPDWLQTASLVGDYYVLGNPSAPVRLIDYSDFF